MSNGTVFNIQKFCTDDGPGIRTTVFLKGCPLRCAWCANPESQARMPQMLWDQRKCAHCGACVASCENEALSDDGHTIVIDHTQCAVCLRCAEQCPQQALEVSGRQYSIEEIVSICEQDRAFYEESGGGITLSGGEPLSQLDFACALMARLRDRGLHVALETSGHIRPAQFARALPLIDLFLIDIKHHDDAAHLEGVGVSRAWITENLRQATAHTEHVLVRIPVIPGFNSSEADAGAFAQLIRACGVRRVQPLPFHQLGEAKYDQLGLPYSMRGVPALSDAGLNAFAQVLEKNGLTCVR
ncbi:glycyl-radical enzyme activating protein [Eubacteriales bacterium OttesenSCG-928-A19]|nr:glycyl-radical enzyme activating protein [Eubacteriales bacterium OttesenSCG-928-A19]